MTTQKQNRDGSAWSEDQITISPEVLASAVYKAQLLRGQETRAMFKYISKKLSQGFKNLSADLRSMFSPVPE